LAERYGEGRRADTLREDEEESSSQRRRAVRCGLDLSASCEQGNELSVGFLF